jgi:putative peptidyl-prolyl cis-trans isomerase
MPFSLLLFAWERYDGVIAVVNSIPIIESELNMKFELHKNKKNIPPMNYPYEKSRLLDRYVEDALVMEAAKDQSIIINDQRVLSQLQKFMVNYFIKKGEDQSRADDLASQCIERLDRKIQKKKLSDDPELDKEISRFVNSIETIQKMDFETYFEELRIHIRREQVMSIAIGVTPPSKKDVDEWYNSNTAKIGYEVRIKHILIKSKGDSLMAQSETNKTISDIRSKILAGESFEKLAQKYSQDPASAGSGGDLGWVWLAELDPYFAGNVNIMKNVNEISRVFKSGAGYHIVKLLGKRPVPLEKVENMIMYKLYTDRMTIQFQKWIEKRRAESDIKIYLNTYVKG